MVVDGFLQVACFSPKIGLVVYFFVVVYKNRVVYHQFLVLHFAFIKIIEKEAKGMQKFNASFEHEAKINSKDFSYREHLVL